MTDLEKLKKTFDELKITYEVRPYYPKNNIYGADTELEISGFYKSSIFVFREGKFLSHDIF